MERTLIGSPVALTYSKATHLLEQPPLPDDKQNYQLSLLLQVLERNLQRLSQHRQRSSPAARQREQRLRAKDRTAATSFHRTRVHRSLGLFTVTAKLNRYTNKN